MEVPTPKPKQPETFIEQRLIVIALRRKMFMEKQAVVQKELNEGWHVKDIQLGVGEKGTNGFMSILLEREYGFTAPPHPDGSAAIHSWYSSTSETHYRDPHGLDEPGDEEEQPYTFNDDGPDLEDN